MRFCYLPIREFRETEVCLAAGRGKAASALYAAFAVVLCLASPILAAPSMAAVPSVAQPGGDPVYDMTVVVWMEDPQPEPLLSYGRVTVALSYCRLVDHKVLRAAIERLALRTGGQTRDVTVADEPLARGSSISATAAQFVLVPGGSGESEGAGDSWPFARANGVLPVAAIIDSFPAWEHMRLVFVAGKGFVFAGPGAVSVGPFSVRLVKGTDVYEYDVVRMSRATTSGARETTAKGEAESPQPGGSARRRAGESLALGLVLLGLMGSAVTWLLIRRLSDRSKGRRPEAKQE